MTRPRLCAGDRPVRETLAGRAGSTVNTIWRAINRVLRLVAATLREIFDESAYQRFLESRRLDSSAKAYAIFRQENEQAKSRRPRCC